MRTRLLSTVVLLTALCFSVSTAHPQDTDKTTTFTEIVGKVVDSSGEPIEKFTVDIQIYDYSKGGFNVTPKTVGKWNGEFENGEFQFDVEDPIKINDKVYINKTVTAEGFLNTNQFNGYTLLSGFKGSFGKIKLSRAIKITGKLVMPDGQQEEELVEPRINVKSKMRSMIPDYSNMFQKTVQPDEDGRFELVVPENCKMELAASCNNAATTEQQITIKKSESAEDEQDLGEIKLKEGVSATGVVVDIDGEPVEGQIVDLQQNAGTNTYMQTMIHAYSVTDAEGKFKLPPREGKGTLTLVKQANIAGKQVKVKGKLIMAKQQKLTLKVGEPANDIEIRESKTWKISGVVNYDKTIGITTQIQASFDGQYHMVELDEEGRFEFEVVDKSKPWISVYGYKGSEMYMANLSSSSLKQFKNRFSGSPENEGTYFQMKKVTSDLGPLEFSLLKQLVDDRGWGERLFDWYYFGE